MAKCKNTLRYVNISDNKSINKAIPELITLLNECKETLTYINISDLNMKPKYLKEVSDAIISLYDDERC